MENQVSMPTGGVSDSSQAPGHSNSMGDGNYSDISSSNANIQLESGKADNNMITALEVDLILAELVPKLRERVQLGNSDAVGSFLAACKHFQTHLDESRQCELRELKPHSHNEDEEEIVGQSCQPTSEDNEQTNTLIGSSISNMHDETAKFVIFHQSAIADVLSKSIEIGKRGCGSVYKGELFGNTVAIKKLHSVNKSGEEEFLQEVGVLYGMHHPNLVKLLGACFQTPALVYEYLPNRSVDDHLKKNPWILSWKIRTGIIFETCLALKFLHSKSVVHGDVKPGNILLDANFNSKVCDFGYSRFLPEGIGMHVYLETAPKGTLSYVDPKFFKTGILRPASDLYSFGVTILRLLTGMPPKGLKKKVQDASESSFRYMIDLTAGSWPFDVAKELRCWALQCCQRNDKSSELLVDMSIGLEFMLEEIASTTTISGDVSTLSSSIEGGSKPATTPSNSTMELDRGKDNTIQITELWDNEEAKTLSDGTSSEDELSASGIGTHASSFSDTSSGITLFSHSEILAATNGLSESSKIGRGGYGSVYKGFLCGNVVAIKLLDSKGNQGQREFFQEMEVLHKIRHPNVVELLGACHEDHAIVYEFLTNGSLEDCLEGRPRLLTWQIRIHIIHEICSVLIFLHSRSMVHGDLKPNNILLDANLNSKLADFGLCRLLAEDPHTKAFDETVHIGTWGYIDPSFIETGILGPGSDIYSFGVIILKILTGMPPSGLLWKVKVASKDEKLLQDMLDPTAGQWPFEIAGELAQWGLKCCKGKRNVQNLLENMLASLDEVLSKIG